MCPPPRRRRRAPRAAAAALALLAAACGPSLEPRATPSPRGPAPAEPTPAPDGPAFAYAAGSASYRVVGRADIEVVDDSAGGRDSVETVAQVRVAIAPAEGAAGTARLVATVDSFTVRSAGRVPTAPLPLPVRLEGEVRAGRVTLAVPPPAAPPAVPSPLPGAASAADDCAAPASVVLGAVRDLFPAMPPRLAPGARWADTVTTTSCRGGVRLVTTSVHRYAAAGTEERGGRPAVRVERTSDVTVRGEGVQARVPVTTEGRGAGRGTLWMDPAAGRVLEATTEATLELTFTAAGRAQRVVQRSTQTIRLSAPGPS